jgi:class 3 adenylate cyclase
MAIRVLELHHHSVRVAPSPQDVERARNFYVEVLGLGVDPGRVTGSGVPGHWLNVGDHGQIHLIGSHGSQDHDPSGIDTSEPHVALAVADLPAARTELERRGIKFRVANAGRGPEHTQLFLRDPAGNLIELRQWDAGHGAARSRAGETNGYTRVRSTVMFADMRGFTRVSERLSPTEVVPLLNEYFELLTGIAVEHGGTVFNMAGDGLMIGFGVPFEQADASRRAVDTAREMLARFGQLSDSWKRRHDVETGLGIGINAGEVIAGHVGSARFTSYTIVGDTVNVASRLSQRARAGEALFSAGVRANLDDGEDYPLLELPALQLRGRAAPVQIYCLPAAERLDLREV